MSHKSPTEWTLTEDFDVIDGPSGAPSGSGQPRHHNTRSKGPRAQGRPEAPAAGGGRSAAAITAGHGDPVAHSRVPIVQADAIAPSSDAETFQPTQQKFCGRAAFRYVLPCECVGG